MALMYNFHPYSSRLRSDEPERRSPFHDLNGFEYLAVEFLAHLALRILGLRDARIAKQIKQFKIQMRREILATKVTL